MSNFLSSEQEIFLLFFLVFEKNYTAEGALLILDDFPTIALSLFLDHFSEEDLKGRDNK